MDLYPTLLEAAGVPVTHYIEGQSFMPVLKGGTPTRQDRYLFFSRREGNLRYNGKTVEAVRLGAWKLVQNSPYAPPELFNLEEDPLEQDDLSKDYPGIFRRLAAALRRHIQEAGKVPWQRSQ